jgi:ABC-type bacteriocin/lantibiotic exporter with double-glycine peptidase domain
VSREPISQGKLGHPFSAVVRVIVREPRILLWSSHKGPEDDVHPRLKALLHHFRRDVPAVLQMELSECGAACLAMILRYFGNFEPLGEIRARCGTSRDGTTAAAIVRAAATYGLDTAAYRLGADAISGALLPAIAHWQGSHFVVIERVGRRRATIIDPLQGRLSIDRSALRRSYSGVLLSFKPNSAFQRRGSRNPSLARCRDAFAGAKAAFAVVAAGTLMLEILMLLPPIGTQFLVDQVIGLNRREWLLPVALVLVGTVVCRLLLVYVRTRTLRMLEFALDVTLMGASVRHLLDVPPEFHLRRTPGDLMQRVQANAEL